MCNMKQRIKQLAIALLTLCLTLSAHAQDTRERVFLQIYNSAQKVANDPQESMQARKVATFKVDAIDYMKRKTLNILTDTTQNLTNDEIAAINNRLDSMAYFMYDYVNLFTKEYSRARGKRQKQRVLNAFREASINNPLFNDADRQLVLAYYNREDYLTQFSLDTDWVKALAEVKEKLKKI